ncbi:hypothetical protein GGX14DRAFT_387851 [Mycena pura]|uniref:Uncharacterized protein n=1 Tax=Mycena pura TaxID=153505 RepID=A0AAD7E2H4_9AGAR|nr:hypothetical protein GGX14DRAFT_387851 [Mycena pura]
MAAHPVALSRGRRMLHASPSLASLASSLSSLSLYTTTSSRTLWGPGALAEKAILALGKATVRGAGRVVIARRMNVIQAHLPCMDESPGADPAVMDALFDDLLELSRPGLYPDSIRHAAMDVIQARVGESPGLRPRSWALFDDLLELSRLYVLRIWVRAKNILLSLFKYGTSVHFTAPYGYGYPAEIAAATETARDRDTQLFCRGTGSDLAVVRPYKAVYGRNFTGYTAPVRHTAGRVRRRIPVPVSRKYGYGVDPYSGE